MKRRLIREVTAVAYAVVAFGAVVAPALVLSQAAARGGIAPSLQALDLAAVSAIVASAYSIVTYRRLRRQSTQTRSLANVWIAAVHALVVLALLASLLLAVVLHGLGPLQAPIAANEVTLLALWGAVHAVAVLSAEVTERAVFRWLVAPEAAARRRRRHAVARSSRPG